MEMADGMAITKADGDNVQKARLARQSYQNALHMFPASPYGWIPKVEVTSAPTQFGIDQVWDMVLEYEKCLKEGDFWEEKRKNQVRDWMHDSILQNLKDDFYSNTEVSAHFKATEDAVISGEENPFQAAQKLLGLYHGKG